MRITSREEARNVLECLSPPLARSIVAIAICDIKTSKELARALGMSVRNAQRMINTLESIKAIKVIKYGKQKIIASLNPYYEKEVVESIKTLVPIVIDSLRLPALKLDKYHREIVTTLVRVLGIRGKPKDNISRIVLNIVRNGLERKPLPHWLKRILNAEETYRIRIASDSGNARKATTALL